MQFSVCKWRRNPCLESKQRELDPHRRPRKGRCFLAPFLEEREGGGRVGCCRPVGGHRGPRVLQDGERSVPRTGAGSQCFLFFKDAQDNQRKFGGCPILRVSVSLDANMWMFNPQVRYLSWVEHPGSQETQKCTIVAIVWQFMVSLPSPTNHGS